MKCTRLIKVGVAICIATNFVGCNKTTEVWKPLDNQTIKIAIVGDDEYIYDNGSMEAMELASNNFYAKTGIKVETVIYDDDFEYNKAISCAKEIVADNSISAVLVKQELDFIDSTGEIFNQAKKPFIVTNGCYESTIDNGYKYMLVDCINAEIAGKVMADYVIEKGYKSVAFCHSDTEYEEDELKGFQSAINDTDINFVDTMIGPYSQEEFNIAYEKWNLLGVDAVCISNYDILNSDLVKMLREKKSDIDVIGDYVMNTDDEIDENGKYLEGTAIVGMYINDENENNAEILKQYKDTYGFEMSEKAIQSYDIISMLGERIISGVETPEQLIKSLKNGESYSGISGTVEFDEKGCIIPNGNEVLIFKNGNFS